MCLGRLRVLLNTMASSTPASGWAGCPCLPHSSPGPSPVGAAGAHGRPGAVACMACICTAQSVGKECIGSRLMLLRVGAACSLSAAPLQSQFLAALCTHTSGLDSQLGLDTCACFGACGNKCG